MALLAKKTKCTGCFACEASCEKKAISKQLGNDGFYYPVINKSLCIDCGNCSRVCPIQNGKIENHYTEIYAAYSLTDKHRSDSSSGGVFTELAEHVIGSGGCVYGASFDEDFTVKHICVSDIAKLNTIRGAKYAQSDVQSCFQEIKSKLIRGEFVLFIGTPCQVGGLKQYLGQKYSNIIYIDFICHGIPSPVVWKKYIEYRQRKDAPSSRLKNVEMRSKITGWNNYNYSSVYTYECSTNVVIKNGMEPFMNLFLQEKINRLSCSDCHFKINRASDITLGDCWGIWNFESQLDTDRGVSLVLINTEEGNTFFNSIKMNLNSIKLDVYDFKAYNPAYIMSFRANTNRRSIIKKILDGDVSYYDDTYKPGLIERVYSFFRSK